jgi:hypothetical protein
VLLRTRQALFLSALLAAPLIASAQASAPVAASAPASAPARVVAPVVQLGVDVPPFYIAGTTRGAPAKVSIDPAYDKLLSSMKRANVVTAEHAIGARPELVKPETLIALAMRLYDVGLRDDAVFWYYVGRDRFVTMQFVLDMRSMQLARTNAAIEQFLHAAGPAMEGYAYCSVARQQELESRAINWVAAHPYKILGYTELPAATEDRNAALAQAVNEMREDARERKARLEDPAGLAGLEEARDAVHAHERFCW